MYNKVVSFFQTVLFLTGFFVAFLFGMSSSAYAGPGSDNPCTDGTASCSNYTCTAADAASRNNGCAQAGQVITIVAVNLTCNDAQCTLSQSPSVAGATGVVYTCPYGTVNGKCLENPSALPGTYQPGQTINIAQFLQTGCGAIQIDFDTTGATGTGGAGAAVIDTGRPCAASQPSGGGSSTGTWTNCGSCNCTEAGVGDRGPECQRNPQGQCVWNPSLCGPKATPPPPKPVCGEACSIDSDCAPAAGFGVQVVCRAGRCENATCPAGQTIFGNNCTCGANAQRCGQPCGHAFGLCAEGVCRYVNVSSPGYCPWGWPQTYCVGTQNGYQNKQCTVGDTPGAYLEGPNGKLVGFTVQEMQASCQLCGDGLVQPPEECDAGSKNGTAETTCGINCKYVQATPTPTPLPFVCVSVTKDIDSPKVGQSVRFTCGSAPGATKYEFRYQRIPPSGEPVASGSSSSADSGAIATTVEGSNVTLPFVITKPGTYKVQCRPCKDDVCLPFEVL